MMMIILMVIVVVVVVIMIILMIIIVVTLKCAIIRDFYSLVNVPLTVSKTCAWPRCNLCKSHATLYDLSRAKCQVPHGMNEQLSC